MRETQPASWLATVSLGAVVAGLGGCSTTPQTSLPPAASRAAVRPEQVLEAMRRAHQVPHVDPKAGKPAMIVTDQGTPNYLPGFIWWLDKEGRVASYTTDCGQPGGAIVDHSGRLIVACGVQPYGEATINIYKKGNTTGPADVALMDPATFVPNDVFEDKRGDIFAVNLYGNSGSCSGYCKGDIVWWTPANQSTGSLPSGAFTDKNLTEDFFADVDSSGNVYLDGVIIYNSSVIPEFDTITNIMGKHPSVTQDSVNLNFPGGVYVMGNGKISVIDQGCGFHCGRFAVYIYQSIPGSFETLTPPQNKEGTCNPVSGGYDASDKLALIADFGCHSVDRGVIASNRWKSLMNADFISPFSAAFLDSDK